MQPPSPEALRSTHSQFLPDRCPVGGKNLPPTPHGCPLPASQGTNRRSHPDPLNRSSGARSAAPPPGRPAPPADPALPAGGRALRRCHPPAPHRRLRCVTPASPLAAGRYLRAVLQSLFQEKFVDGGHVGAAARLGAGSWVRGDGRRPRTRPGGGARPRPSSPRGRPRVSAGSGARRLPGSSGGVGAAARGRSLLPVPVRRRKRVTGRAGGSAAGGGWLPAAITSSGLACAAGVSPVRAEAPDGVRLFISPAVGS